MLEELLATVLELAFGNVQGLSVAVSLLVGAHYLGYAKSVVAVARNLRLVAVVVAAMMLTGVLDVGEVMGLVSAGAGLLTGLLA